MSQKTNNCKTPLSLGVAVEHCLNEYLRELNGELPTGLFQLVTREVERPLLEIVMAYSQNNQSQAARVLGINRNTLRSKLDLYDLL